MSQKITHKSSSMNRSTCGGPRKEGIVPLGTGQMVSVKRNHIFSSNPAQNVNLMAYPKSCGGGGASGASSGSGSGSGGSGSSGSSGSSMDFNYDKVYNASFSIAVPTAASGTTVSGGSGFIVKGSNGKLYGITCAHISGFDGGQPLLSAASNITEQSGSRHSGGKSYCHFHNYNGTGKRCVVKANSIGSCGPNDVAILQFEPSKDMSNQDYLEFGNSDDAEPGTMIAVVGSPGLYDDASVALGVVRDNHWQYWVGQSEALMCDASITGGNSGSPMVMFNDGVKVVGKLSFSYGILSGGPTSNSIQTVLESTITKMSLQKPVSEEGESSKLTLMSTDAAVGYDGCKVELLDQNGNALADSMGAKEFTLDAGNSSFDFIFNNIKTRDVLQLKVKNLPNSRSTISETKLSYQFSIPNNGDEGALNSIPNSTIPSHLNLVGDNNLFVPTLTQTDNNAYSNYLGDVIGWETTTIQIPEQTVMQGSFPLTRETQLFCAQMVDSYGDGWNGATMCFIDQNGNKIPLLNVDANGVHDGSATFTDLTGPTNNNCTLKYFRMMVTDFDNNAINATCCLAGHPPSVVGSWPGEPWVVVSSFDPSVSGGLPDAVPANIVDANGASVPCQAYGYFPTGSADSTNATNSGSTPLFNTGTDQKARRWNTVGDVIGPLNSTNAKLQPATGWNIAFVGNGPSGVTNSISTHLSGVNSDGSYSLVSDGSSLTLNIVQDPQVSPMMLRHNKGYINLNQAYQVRPYEMAWSYEMGLSNYYNSGPIESCGGNGYWMTAVASGGIRDIVAPETISWRAMDDTFEEAKLLGIVSSDAQKGVFELLPYAQFKTNGAAATGLYEITRPCCSPSSTYHRQTLVGVTYTNDKGVKVRAAFGEGESSLGSLLHLTRTDLKETNKRIQSGQQTEFLVDMEFVKRIFFQEQADGTYLYSASIWAQGASQVSLNALDAGTPLNYYYWDTRPGTKPVNSIHMVVKYSGFDILKNVFPLDKELVLNAQMSDKIRDLMKENNISEKQLIKYPSQSDNDLINLNQLNELIGQKQMDKKAENFELLEN